MKTLEHKTAPSINGVEVSRTFSVTTDKEGNVSQKCVSVSAKTKGYCENRAVLK